MSIEIIGGHRRRHKDFLTTAVSLQQVSRSKNLKKHSRKRNFADQAHNKHSLRVYASVNR
jgi:hypothetical protein